MRMQLRVVVMIVACGPDKSGAEAGAPVLSESSSETGGGVGSTGGASTMDAPTGGVGMTGMMESTGMIESTGGPAPMTAMAMATIGGRPSALEGVGQWPADPEMLCPNPPNAMCGTPPVLGEPMFFIDGEFAAPGGIALGKRVAVLFAYGDAACDVECGGQTAFVEDGIEGAAGGGSPQNDMPCATEASNFWLALDFGEIQRLGEHTGGLRLSDSCGAESVQRLVSFFPQP